MSKNEAFQWILYFPSQNIVLKKIGIFFSENYSKFLQIIYLVLKLPLYVLWYYSDV
jgi:hypothetical protein